MVKKLKELSERVHFRDAQFQLLYDLLIKSEVFLTPLIHVFGLSGTGKTYAIKKFMNTFCDNQTTSDLTKSKTNNKYYIYLNCNELCYSSVSLIFNEILKQVRTILNSQDKELGFDTDAMKNHHIDAADSSINFDIQEECLNLENYGDEEISRTADCSMFIRHLKKLFSRFLHDKTCLFFVFDNADNLKSFSGDSVSNLMLTLCKINEYINNEIDFNESCDSNGKKTFICNLFISEIDWHSLLSDFDLMSKTEAPRPLVIYFNEYTKEQMYVILKKTASSLVKIQEEYNTSIGQSDKNLSHLFDIEFYAKIILDVFFPICKDLNEIQYLIQIYYDQLISSINGVEHAMADNEKSLHERMIFIWNRMKPFLKQALTQIYLRQSMADGPNQTSGGDDLTKCFESLNIDNQTQHSQLQFDTNKSSGATNHLPKLMKFLLISAYVATHNPVKYDKKLFDYNSIVKNARKSRFTAQKFQQNEENQRAAALKTQSFDLNRLLAIFFAICSENGYMDAINLNLIETNIKTLKSLHYLQQTNSAYSSLDEPKFKCLLDFDTIQAISTSIQFNIKQYLAEYITI